MPARRLERLGDADIAARLGVAHRGQQLVLGLELDVADRERTDPDAGVPSIGVPSAKASMPSRPAGGTALTSSATSSCRAVASCAC